MTTQPEQAHRLRNLHVKGDPLLLFNIWDPGSARAIQKAGAKVLATGSWAVAAAHGYEDGESLPFDLVLGNLERIIRHTHLPVTIDIEGGYGRTPAQLRDNIRKVIEAGAVGVNFEDQVIGTDELYSISKQIDRIRAVREAAEQASIPIFINARTDLFFKSGSGQSDELLDDALQRVAAYTKAGADGCFVPGLRNARLIERLCKESPIPVNIMIMPDTPTPAQLAGLGVARISYGPGPYCKAMDAVKTECAEVLSSLS